MSSPLTEKEKEKLNDILKTEPCSRVRYNPEEQFQSRRH
ncbi:Uncharacterized protein dnm_057000 [Desulfonema magnum]|uniref:Uncharacterized protein n=1 Tax=Desulfonema magnum TaxID=45655 RepID=A0A975BPU0_9BACT|nr:Uncharacterized protein dnm_057000 [Desulfonema magnum]